MNGGHLVGRCSCQKMARALTTIVALCVCGSFSVFVLVSMIKLVICSCI
jgi:hypothetical protein